MYKLCKTEQSAKRQKLLEQGLLEMMKTVHYDEIMVIDLCNQLGIPRKAFYRYFTGKEGALHALIDHTMMEYEGFSQAKQQGKKRSLQLELETFFQFWEVHRDFLDALHKSGLTGIMLERATAYSVSEGVFPIRFLQDEELVVRRQVVVFAVCGLISMVLQWHRDGFRESPQKMAGVAKRLLNQPLFPKVEEMMF